MRMHKWIACIFPPPLKEGENCRRKGQSQLNSTAILVLGMHRSGTSATAGCLRNLGVRLGRRKRLLGPADHNPRGHFEHAGIMKLHDTLLCTLGSRWDNPSPLPEGWERDSCIDHLRNRLKAILLRDFAGAGLWGVKDPRMCRLLPVWLPLLSELGVEIKALHVVRAPGAVAASLAARDAMPEEQAFALWLSHSLSAEWATRRLARTVMLYDDLIADWRARLLE